MGTMRDKRRIWSKFVPGLKIRPDPEKDWLLKKNAEEMALKIKTYWEKRGKKVKIWLEALPRRPKEAGDWAIRSDINPTT